MNRQILCSESSNRGVDRVMEPEQFTQVIEAILAGKYSGACVLILRFAGHNPLHYIPYRTYNRLVKDNRSIRRLEHYQSNGSKGDRHVEAESKQKTPNPCLNSIQDLAYLEKLNEELCSLNGGRFEHWLGCKFQKLRSLISS